MSSRVLRGVLVLALTSACSVQTELPDDVAVSCRAPADCPAPLVCQPRTGLCVGELDDVAPEVLSATAVSGTSVVVAVSEALVELRPELVVITTPLEGERLAAGAVSSSADGLTLTITTLTQLPGITYVVDLSAASDRQANTMSSGRATAAFRGFGGAPDTSAPEILLPALGARVIVGSARRPVDLIWTARAGASTYTAEVSDAPDFSNIVATLVTSREQISAQFTPLAPVTYYWRVRADVTESSALATGRFSVIEDALHVYCAPGADCGAAAGPELGDRTTPFRSISRALTAARAEGLGTVNVAGRGADAYQELLAVPGGLVLRGGYAPALDEATRDVAANPTTVSAAGNVLNIGPVEEPVVIDGLRFVSQLQSGLPAEAQQLFVATVSGATAQVTLTRCALETVATPDAATGLLASTRGEGNVRLTGGTMIRVRETISQSVGVLVNVGASVTLDEGSSVVVDTPVPDVTDQSAFGVVVGPDALFTARRASVQAPPKTLSATLFAQGGTIDVDESALLVPAGEHGPVILAAGIFGSPVAMTVTRSRIACAGCALLPTAIFLWDAAGLVQATFVNNLILVDAASGTTATAIQMTGRATAMLVHNTIVAGGVPTVAVQTTGGTPILTNNLIVCSDGGVGFDERPNTIATDPLSFQGNTIVGCDTAYRDESDASLLTTGAQIDALNGGEIAATTCTGCQHSRYGLNVVSSVAPALFFEAGVSGDGRVDTSAAFRPSSAAAADVASGKSTAGGDCGSIEAPVFCGDVTIDLDGATRASPPTRGALEVP